MYSLLDNKLVRVINDKLYYNGFQFNKYSGRYVKKEYQNANIFQFHCKNYRRDERFRKGKGNFCNAEIILETSMKNNIFEQKFIMAKDHSLECKNLEIINPNIKKEINNLEDFKDLYLNFLETADTDETKYLLKEFNKIYKMENMDFDYMKKKWLI